VVERCFVDKDVVIGRGSVVGRGDASVANLRFPDHVYSGITLLGKCARVPEGITLGTNCIVHPAVKETDFTGPVPDGETISAEARG